MHFKTGTLVCLCNGGYCEEGWVRYVYSLDIFSLKISMIMFFRMDKIENILLKQVLYIFIRGFSTYVKKIGSLFGHQLLPIEDPATGLDDSPFYKRGSLYACRCKKGRDQEWKYHYFTFYSFRLWQNFLERPTVSVRCLSFSKQIHAGSKECNLKKSSHTKPYNHLKTM